MDHVDSNYYQTFNNTYIYGTFYFVEWMILSPLLCKSTTDQSLDINYI